jgi:hypothetical protein
MFLVSRRAGIDFPVDIIAVKNRQGIRRLLGVKQIRSMQDKKAEKDSAYNPKPYLHVDLP